MNNIGARYKIIGRITNGTSVIAYVVEDALNKTVYPLEKGVIEQLALNKQIYNCTAQVYGNIVNLRGIDCKLNQMPRYDENLKPIVNKKVPKRVSADLKIVGKMQKGRVIEYYVLESLTEPNKPKFKMSRDNVITLAKQGRIINAKCQNNKNETMLRGAPGYNLTKLKNYYF